MEEIFDAVGRIKKSRRDRPEGRKDDVIVIRGNPPAAYVQGGPAIFAS